MNPLYVTEQGSRISVTRRRLLVHKQGALVVRAPLAHTSLVVLCGNVSVTTPAIKRMLGAGLDVVFLTQRGQYVGRLAGPLSKSGQLRASQYEAVRDPAFARAVAGRIVQGKLRNMNTMLLRYGRELADPAIIQAAERIKGLAARAQAEPELETLLGLEGSAGAAYFGVFGRLLRQDWGFAGRKRRPPTDPANVLLSLGYTLLTSALESAALLVGLDPYLGLLHQPRPGRPSLALDLVEEFRAIVVDSVVLSTLNKGQIVPGDFTRDGANPSRPIRLSQDGLRRFIRAYEERLATEVQHPVTGERIAYRRVFEVQARQMARCFREGKAAYRPFRVR